MESHRRALTDERLGNVSNLITHKISCGELAVALADCRTVLELGCGPQSPMLHFAARLQLEGLDVPEPSLRASEATGLLHEGHLRRVQDAGRLFPERSFDAVVALDLIKHLEKAEGEQIFAFLVDSPLTQNKDREHDFSSVLSQNRVFFLSERMKLGAFRHTQQTG